MNEFNQNSASIKYLIVDDELHKISESLKHHFCTNISISHSKKLLKDHVPEIVKGRTQIMLETLLNRKIEDAIKSLADSSINVKNNFYALELREKFRDSFSPNPLNFSADKRIILGIIVFVCWIVTTGISTYILANFNFKEIDSLYLQLCFAVFFGLKAFGICLFFGSKWERRNLEKEVFIYLIETNKKINLWFENIITRFDEKVSEFKRENEI